MSDAREFQVTFDCADPAVLAEFWAAALHYVIQPPPKPFGSWDEALDAWGVPPEERTSRSAIVDPGGHGPRVFFQRVPEGKTTKNRVHLDVRAAPGAVDDERRALLKAEAQRLVGLGASIFRVLEPTATEQLCLVMQDPEGNEFCLD